MPSPDFPFAFHFGALEPWGVSLVRVMISRFRLGDKWPDIGNVAPEGPHFVFERTPSLFLGREGRGSLRIAWDTNLLLDYFTHGAKLWEGDGLVGPSEDRYGEELEALQILIAVWVARDIDFILLPPTLRDSKKKALSADRVQARSHAMRAFEDALQHSSVWTEEHPESRTRELPSKVKTQLLGSVPAGNDRLLVESALDSNVHVFLTRDQGILKSAHVFRAVGILIVSPQDMLGQLGATGALHAFFEPSYFYWPMPDQARVEHLVRALGVGNFPNADRLV